MPGAPSFLAFCALTLSFAAYGQTLTVTTQPTSLTIYPGQQNIPIAVTITGSYAGPIFVSLAGLPSGVSFTPATVTAGGTGTLSLSASMSAGQEGFSPFSPSPATGWTAPVTVIATAGSTQATAQVSLTISISNSSFAPAASAINLPILKIDTSGAPVVSKTTDVPGTVLITSADGQTSYLPNSSDTDNTATFHVHGNSTAIMPKLPYEMKLNTSLDLLNTMGLSCPYVTGAKAKPTCDKSKTYVLLANYDDKTFLRDWSASALANAIPLTSPYLTSPAGSPSPSGTSTPMPWAPHSLFVELYLNGVYEGNYQLIEKVNVDSHRINITELTDTDTADVTGGYLLEIDHGDTQDFFFTTPQGLPIGMADPDFTPEVPQQTAYITSYVDQAETALFSSNFTDPTLGWRAYFDEASAVNFYIVNDLIGNVDGGDFYSSDYLYKDLDNPLFYMGSIWDFDISSGNVNYQPIVNPTVPWMQVEAPWYVRWFQDPAFQSDAITQWNNLKNNGVLSDWLTSIPQQAKTLEQSQANNFSRWPMLGMAVWPNAEVANSFDGEVTYLTDWLQLRFAYLDSEFNAKQPTTTTLTVGAGTLRSGSPVTLSAQVTGGTAPTGVVTFLSLGVVVGAGTLTNGTASFTTSNLPAGTDQIEAVYNGDQTNGLSGSAAQSVIVAPPLTSAGVAVAVTSTLSQGGAANFTAAVLSGSSTVVPTGTVTFSEDGGVGSAVTLDGSGRASYTTSSLTAGTHMLTALYSGDATFAPAIGSSTLQVAADFTIDPSGTSVTAQAGNAAILSYTLSPSNGAVTFPSAVTFAVQGLPPGATYSFSPTSVAAGSASTSVTLTVQLPDSAATGQAALDRGRTLAPLSLGLLLFPFVGRVRRGRKKLNRSIPILLLLAGLAVMSCVTGCGSQSTYSVVVTGTEAQSGTGVLSHSASVTLTVK